MPRTKRERITRNGSKTENAPRWAVPLLLLLPMLALVTVPATSHAQLTSGESKCVQTLTKDGSKVSKSESKLAQKCMKDAANGKLIGTADACIADDEKGKVAKSKGKTLSDEAKQCGEGTGFVVTSGAQVNASSEFQTLALTTDLLGGTVDSAVQIDKNNAKCQQKVQKALDKVLATKLKSYAKCLKTALTAATDVSSLNNCLLGLPADSKVLKAISKLGDARSKSCAGLTLSTIFPGSCSSAIDEAAFDDCADALAECRACTLLGGENGLTVDCDLFDNGVADLSCASSAPTCGDGNIDPGEECDPGAEPICCSATCTNELDGLSCDDGAFCTGVDTCLSGACVSTGDPCSGGGECNVVCNEGPDTCFDAGGTACTDDGNVCTDDECDGSGNCIHPGNVGGCDDGDACTTADTCNGFGLCIGGAPPNCNDSNGCTDDSCDSGVGCQNVNNSAPCDDGLFCNGADTCGSGSCSIHAGDPCLLNGQCNVTCNEGPDNCFDPNGTVCDQGAPGANDACDQTADECDGAGNCANLDPAEGPELCYVAGDEDCDGAADSADPDPNSICATNGTESCTCADACEIRRILPVVGGAPTSLNGLAPWSVNGMGTVETTDTGFEGTGTRNLAYTFAGKPANLALWWGMTDDALPGQIPPRGSASEPLPISDAAGALVAGLGTTTVIFPRVSDPIPCTVSPFHSACPSTDNWELDLDTSASTWATFSSLINVSALAPAAVATEATTYLTGTPAVAITGASHTIGIRETYEVGSTDTAIDSVFDPAHTSSIEFYGINFTPNIYGTFRNANVCP